MKIQKIEKTTIQTLNDSKLLKLAENIIPEDDSLDSFRKKSLLYNKRHFRVYSPKKYKKQNLIILILFCKDLYYLNF